MTGANDEDDRRVASLDAARRRKAEQERTAKRAAAAAGASGSPGQRLFGVVIAAMAVGYIAWLVGAFDAATPLREPGPL